MPVCSIWVVSIIQNNFKPTTILILQGCFFNVTPDDSGDIWALKEALRSK